MTPKRGSTRELPLVQPTRACVSPLHLPEDAPMRVKFVLTESGRRLKAQKNPPPILSAEG